MVVGPGTIAQGAAISEWQSFTPSTTNTWTTNATWTGKYRREGSMARIKYGIALAGAPGGTSQLGINLPTGLTIDTTAILNMARAESLAHVTYYQVNNLGKAYQAIAWGEYDSTQSTTGKMRFLAQDDSSASNHDFAAITASYPNTWGNLDYLVIEAFIPISEWAGNGTVNLGAGAQVEYVSDDGTNDVFGPNGAAIPTITAGTGLTSRTFSFQYPWQNDDTLLLEVRRTGLTNWEPAEQLTYIRSAANDHYGMRGRWTSSTVYQVDFGNRGYDVAAGFGVNGNSWNDGVFDRWRVRKAKASSPVGFGLARAGESGLINYYQEDDTTLASVTWNPDGGGTNSTAFAVKITRIGRIVTLSFPAKTATATTSTTALTLSATLPTWARPYTNQELAIVMINSSWQAGSMEISTAGVVKIYKLPLGAAFAAASAGTDGVNISYSV
jgi:hypothetical protein